MLECRNRCCNQQHYSSCPTSTLSTACVKEKTVTLWPVRGLMQLLLKAIGKARRASGYTTFLIEIKRFAELKCK
jgi:hypothetical protein